MKIRKNFPLSPFNGELLKTTPEVVYFMYYLVAAHGDQSGWCVSFANF